MKSTIAPPLWSKAKQVSDNTWQSLTLALGASTPLSIGIILTTLLTALLPLVIAYLGKIITDAVVAHDLHRVITWVVAEFVVITGQALALRALNLFRTLLGQRLSLIVNVLMLKKASQLELSQFEDSEIYDKLNRAWRESSSRPAQMVNDALQFVQNLLTLFGYMALLLGFNPWVVLGLILASIPSAVAETYFSKINFRLQNRRSPERRKQAYIEYILANDSHAKEVKVLGLGPTLLGSYEKQGLAFYQQDKSLSVQRARWAFALAVMSTAAFYGCYLWLAISATTSLISLGSLALYVVSFRQGQQAFQSCLGAISSLYENNLYMANLFEFLNLRLDPVFPVVDLTKSGPVPENGIYFDQVGFRYAGREEWALRDITLHIPKGQSVALMGYNGAGKTTLIKLLCRFYQPTEGRIFLDGRDLREMDRAELWERIGVIFQDFNKYHFTLAENVGMGEIAEVENAVEIDRAIRQGGASEVLKVLPQGLKTQLGRWFAGGVELSGGQWQKVALARAFMRTKSDVIILDEPTSALDAEAEHAVFERFRELTKGKTSLIISHRFPTARLADRILVIEKGRLIEHGTHAELIALNGTYQKLFSLQANGYL